jgi:hypothetical protein
MELAIQSYLLLLWDQDRQQLPGFLSDRAATIKILAVHDMYSTIIRIKQHLLYLFFGDKLCIYFPVIYYGVVYCSQLLPFFIKDNKHYYLYTSERNEWKYPFSANLEAEYIA